MIYALCLEDDFVDIVLDSLIKLVEKFLTDFVPSVLFENHQHGNVGFTGIGGVVVSYYATYKFIFMVGHDGEIGPIC